MHYKSGQRGITNRGRSRGYKVGQKDNKLEQGLQSGTNRS